MMKPVINAQLFDFINQMANASATIIKSYFRTHLTVDDKPDTSPVTLADKAVEQKLREMIEKNYPHDGIYGEEFGTKNENAEFTWVIDPIDGTKSFITGKPLFGTLIALIHQGKPILGLLDQPILKERWIGGQHLPTTLNGHPIHVRACTDIKKAALYATTPAMFLGADFEAFGRVRDTVKMTIYGGDCYAYALLATGFVDLVIESSLKPYDYCALAPIVENAGGIMTDWQGQPLTIHSDGRVIAAGDAHTHQQALNLLQQ
ncbi:histidinol-phosphate phosphatase HisN, inositol monophosphatase family [Beggiatoa alba B18LD]|uniref:Histidinol-phosphatase n=1 Tax=Beggiatoa alba B18LD TaxID=395493 RepID=I3CGZ2_9GAMM|nr:histidinol-phosphatase [Beggiatoa alba]EIJ42885.1 histidinol-phosphate phosphatase HisN, inositol monophosphatase family [Beggiatoa alba B18LD]